MCRPASRRRARAPPVWSSPRPDPPHSSGAERAGADLPGPPRDERAQRLGPGAAAFVAGRLLQGVGGGIVSVVLYVLIARIISAGARPAMFGLLTTAWLVPSMAGPVVAGALAQLLSWRAVFALILCGSGVALLVLLRVVRSGGGPTGPTARYVTIMGRTGRLSLLAAGVLVLLHLGAQSGGLRAPILVGAGLVALVARTLLPPGTLRLRGAAQRLVALRAGFGVSSAVPDVYLTLYLQAERGLSPTASSSSWPRRWSPPPPSAPCCWSPGSSPSPWWSSPRC